MSAFPTASQVARILICLLVFSSSSAGETSAEEKFPHLKTLVDKYGVSLADSTVAPRPELWQAGPYCGANAAYVLMRMIGLDVQHEAILQKAPVSDKGMSMLDMKQLLASFGVTSELLQVAPDVLGRLPLPFIARLETVGPETGHYVVVYNRNPTSGQYGVVDGTSGAFGDVGAEAFHREFAGQVLISDQPFWLRLADYARRALVAVSCLQGAAISAILLRASKKRFSSR